MMRNQDRHFARQEWLQDLNKLEAEEQRATGWRATGASSSHQDGRQPWTAREQWREGWWQADSQGWASWETVWRQGWW